MFAMDKIGFCRYYVAIITTNFDDRLVGHPYANKLKPNEHSIFIDMAKSLVKLTNILLNLKENNEENMIIIKQVYNVLYVYKRSQRGSRTKMQ